MKECSFLFCGVPNVSIRFYLTRYHPNIMYGQPRGGLQHRNIRTRNTTLKFSTCQGTLGNLFLRQSTSERVECARTTASQGFSGVGRRVGMGARDNPKVICFYIDCPPFWGYPPNPKVKEPHEDDSLTFAPENMTTHIPGATTFGRRTFLNSPINTGNSLILAQNHV